jgi:hypothetical protein
LHGNDFINWEIELTTKDIVELMHDFYVFTGKLDFEGAWGDSYLVEFSEFKATPKFGYFALKGKFRVICVTSDFAPSC